MPPGCVLNPTWRHTERRGKEQGNNSNNTVNVTLSFVFTLKVRGSSYSSLCDATSRVCVCVCVGGGSGAYTCVSEQL